MVFKNLKWQLLASSCVAVIVIACLIALAIEGYTVIVVILAAILAAYIILVNFWFDRNITKPITSLTESAERIAAGSYGTKAQKFDDNEIGELTDEINEMSEKVAQADKATTEFVSQISHELRTPLTAITGWSETLQYDPAIQGDSLRGVSIISKEADRLTSMVTDLLEFTRIQDGRFNLRVELLDIAAELEDSIFTYGELMKQSGVEVSYDAPDYEIPLISGDPERLKQVFLNLLDNATKHGGEGKLVEVVLKTTSNSVLISIRDHGHGIPAAELPYVKNKFYKGSSKNRGSGIGLAVCDEIVTRHGGKLIIANAEGGGCIATIQLPMNKE
ncbi:MAG: HAMP domain-containing sensor histidine kinase [Bacillota bacterium]|nr:HAMP domain-containing sensor histidine kinase [Bacillota bacterium]